MKFGLIGHPIAHSLSPALFKAGYEGRYPYELIQTPDFEEAFETFLKDYDGVNVTAPFKELAFAKADILSPECEAIKATNLLIKTPEGIKAHNSDYLGVRMWLQEVLACPSGLSQSDWEPANKPTALIVGLGGAGKAAAEAARSLGMEVVLMNRTLYNEHIRPLSEFAEHFRKADIVIYNIPTAIDGLAELDEDDMNSGHPKFILEANYKDPSFDKTLIDKMIEANPLIRYTEGRRWLLYQALTGYEIFTGERPDLAAMSAVL